jgi:DNA-binding response OmpR family regulator
MDRKKILVIDDEHDLLALVKFRLEANDYIVVTAADGEEGLLLFKNEKPDLVLLDIIMPKLDGFSVCQTLKKDPLNKDIPVIMLTAKDRPDDIKQAQRCGASGYVIKPFDAETLLFNIKEQLSKIKAE